MKKVQRALKSTQKALKETNKVFELMSDKQRLLFVALSQGKDELEAIISAGMTDNLKIAKIVYTKEGKPRRVDQLNLKNIKELDELSYQRLKTIAASRVTHYIGEFEYTKYIPDIQHLFKLVAPEAFKTVVSIMQESTSEKTKLKAAESILDRAGYQESAQKTEAMPVQVNILIGNQKPNDEVTIINAENSGSY